MVTIATAILPIRRARRATLAGVLGAMAGERSPFASVPQLHNARLEVFDAVPAPSRWRTSDALDPAHLLFGFAFDGTLLDVATSIAAGPRERLDAVFRCCAGYPGSEDAVSLAAYVDAHLVPAALPFLTWDAPVDRVRAALTMHERLAAFAGEAQEMTPAALRAAFRKVFT